VEQPSRSKRWKSLRRNVRREGLSYVPHRVVEGVHTFMDRLSRRVVDHDTVNRLLRDAFPNRDSSLDEIGKRYGASVFRVKNLNAPRAAEILKEENVDLGIVLGTRILKRSTFAVPRLGSINLHKGSVPDYRGLPPGFWELYDGKDSAGITVHFVDDGLDTGDVIGTQRVDIADTDTELSLRTKLDRDGARLLARCVENLRWNRGPASPAGRHTQAPHEPNPAGQGSDAKARALAARGCLPQGTHRQDRRLSCPVLLRLLRGNPLASTHVRILSCRHSPLPSRQRPLFRRPDREHDRLRRAHRVTETALSRARDIGSFGLFGAWRSHPGVQRGDPFR